MSRMPWPTASSTESKPSMRANAPLQAISAAVRSRDVDREQRAFEQLLIARRQRNGRSCQRCIRGRRRGDTGIGHDSRRAAAGRGASSPRLWRSRRRYSARRLMPSTLAAAIRLPFTCRRTSRMCSRSISSSWAGASRARAPLPAVRTRGGGAAGVSGPKAPVELAFGHQSAVGQHARAFDDVLQLADVAFPLGLEQQAFGRRRQAGHRLVHPLRAGAHERGGEIRNVFAPIAEWRKGDLHDVQTIEEIAAEAAAAATSARRSRLVAAITRDVDLLRLQRADALHLAVLERAQQLGLDRQRQLADLVEEQRAALAASNTPAFDSTAPVNAPRTWPNSSLSKSVSTTAEQLIVTNGLLRRGQPDGRRARRAPCPCRFRRSQHDLRVRCQPLDETEQLLHDGAAPEHPAELQLFGDLAFERDNLRPTLQLHADGDQHVAQSIESNGFVRYSRAPSLIASTALSTAAYAVMRMTSHPGTLARI